MFCRRVDSAEEAATWDQMKALKAACRPGGDIRDVCRQKIRRAQENDGKDTIAFGEFIRMMSGPEKQQSINEMVIIYHECDSDS